MLTQEKPSQGKTKPTKTSDQVAEWQRCQADCTYFVANWCLILNATSKRWVPFRLWQAQADTLEVFASESHIIMLKARQLGLTWLTLSYLLWQMLFHPIATVLIFSRRDEEATALLSERLKEIHARLPVWLQETVTESNEHSWSLGNGSSAKAFPTTGGRSYTASHVLIDEADFMPKFGKVLDAVQPTIDDGGQIIVISTVDKEQPSSTFKTMFSSAQVGLIEYSAVFLPWYARPSRTQEWYNKRVADSIAKTGTTDGVFQEYPATVEEALAPSSEDKRIPSYWLTAIFQPLPALSGKGPKINGLTIYKSVEANVQYVIGADPAEGNPQSDDSAATVVELETGEEVAQLRGKFEPAIFAHHLTTIGIFYNKAAVMVERNNHGHTVLLELLHIGKLRRLFGRDKKVGWLNSPVGKVAMYDAMADFVSDNFKTQTKVIHSQDTMLQLASISGSDLRAPENQMDDLADSYALAEVGRAAAMAQPRQDQSRQSVSMVTI